MELNDTGIKLPAKPKALAGKEIAVPDYFTKAITKNKKSETGFLKLCLLIQKRIPVVDYRSQNSRNKK